MLRPTARTAPRELACRCLQCPQVEGGRKPNLWGLGCAKVLVAFRQAKTESQSGAILTAYPFRTNQWAVPQKNDTPIPIKGIPPKSKNSLNQAQSSRHPGVPVRSWCRPLVVSSFVSDASGVPRQCPPWCASSALVLCSGGFCRCLSYSAAPVGTPWRQGEPKHEGTNMSRTRSPRFTGKRKGSNAHDLFTPTIQPAVRCQFRVSTRKQRQ